MLLNTATEISIVDSRERRIKMFQKSGFDNLPLYFIKNLLFFITGFKIRSIIAPKIKKRKKRKKVPKFMHVYVLAYPAFKTYFWKNMSFSSGTTIIGLKICFSVSKNSKLAIVII